MFNRCCHAPVATLYGVLAVLCCFLNAFAFAHDSPEHSIEELTAHIEQEGATVPLLLRRASHYRVTGQAELAIADLRRVLDLEKNQQGALVELARIHLALGDANAALRWINQAIDVAKTDAEDAHLFAVRAQVFAAESKYSQALNDLYRAIAGDRKQVDWYLERSRMHELLGLHRERIAGLHEGYVSTHSAVLFGDWIESLIDGGRSQDALREIEPRLAASRLHSTWLLRRARARLALGGAEYSALAHEDLKRAIAEMNFRLRPSRPDLDLLLDRGVALLLLGDRTAAQHDLELAQTRGAASRQMERLQRLLAREEK